MFGGLLRPPAWKWNGPILKDVGKYVRKLSKQKTIYIEPESTNESGRITALWPYGVGNLACVMLHINLWLSPGLQSVTIN